MKWISVKDKLPETHNTVLVCRVIKVMDFSFQTYDIGHIDRTSGFDRWRLDSQQFSPLPICPTADSGIITHWMPLPKFPKKENE